MNSGFAVTVITVCLNSDKTIERTIESMINQTCHEYEYLIIDGGSTDQTTKIIRKYEPLFNGKMKWISEHDRGIYDAMNKGIAMAHGSLIGILNSDDYYEQDTLQTVLSYMKNTATYPYQILYGMVRTLLDGKEESVSINSHNFIKDRMIGHPACFVTKKLYERYGMFNIKYKSSADYEFMLRVCDEKEIIFVPIYEILTNYLLGGMSTTRKGYIDKIRMLHERNMISDVKYYQLRLIDLIKSILKF